jgi:hypothetical protein
MIQINTHPTPRQLRQFAAIWLPLFGVAVGAMLYWKVDAKTAATIAWGVTIAASIASLASLAIARALFLGLSYATLPIGLAVAWVALAALYVLLITPLALVLRATGRDPLQLRRPSATSLWHRRSGGHDVERAFRQF